MPLLALDHVTQRFGGLVAVNDLELHDRGRFDRRDDRPQRRRQVDGVQPRHRNLPSHRRPDHVRRHRRRRPGDERDRVARHRAHVPEHPAVRVHVGAGERDDGRARAAAREPRRLAAAHCRASAREERAARERAMELLRFVGLERRARARTRATSPTGCSAGSRSRARWRREPKLLLLDEPAAGMNPSEKRISIELIRAHPRSRRHGVPDRARHGAGHGDQRAHHRARPRREDRRRAARPTCAATRA